MKKRLPVLLLLFLSGLGLYSQTEFYGVVRKFDTTASPIYLARVEVLKGADSLTTIKTYFDGSFKFPIEKNETYTVTASFSGYKDSTVIFKTDKKGIPSLQNVTIRLKKDGMRLMGIIKNRDDNFPINDACIILKNILTREEKRIYTGIDGAYNFKMEYETNYKVSIDKRSLGIFNKFKDTAFYVSTIGFNLPLDYKLDILLDPLQIPAGNYQAPPSLVAKNKPVSPPIANSSVAAEKQPFVAENEKSKQISETVTRLQEELAKAKKEIETLKQKEEEQRKVSPGISVGSGAKRRKKIDDEELEVVVIRDEPIKNISPEAQQLNAAEDKAKDIERQIAEKQKEEEIKAANLAALQLAYDDSLAREKEKQDAQLMKAALQQQTTVDSVQKAQSEVSRREEELAAKNAAQADSLAQVKQRQEEEKAKLALQQKHDEDSVNRAKAEAAKAAEELAAKKAEEAEAKAQAEAIRKKFVADSLAQAKLLAQEQAQKTKERIDSIARAKSDAAAKAALELENKKKQEQVTARLRREIEIKDSLFHVDVLQMQAYREAEVKKKREDSIAKVRALEQKLIEEQAAKEKARLEAEAKALAEAEAARIKFTQDSLEQVAIAERKKFVEDSIATVRATEKEAERKAKEEEALRAAKEAEIVARVKREQEALAKEKAEEQKRLKAEALRKKDYEDSLAKAQAIEAKRQYQDSIVKLKAEQERVARELAESKKKQLLLEAAAKQAYADSVYSAKVEAERRAKEEAALKKQEEAARKDQELLQKKQREAELAAQKEQQEKGRILQEEARKLAQLNAEKARKDSLQRVASESARLAKLEAAKKAETDSIAFARKEQQRIWMEDSIEQAQQIATEQKRLKEIAQAAEQKIIQDSMAKAKAVEEQRHLNDSMANETAKLEKLAAALEQARQKAKADSIAAATQLAEQKIKQQQVEAIAQAAKDSLTKAIEQKEQKALQMETKRLQEEAALAKAKQIYADSLAQIKAQQESMAKELELLRQKQENGTPATQLEEAANLEAQEKERAEKEKKIEQEKLALAKLEADRLANRKTPAPASKNSSIAEAGKDSVEDTIIPAEMPAIYFAANEYKLTGDAMKVLHEVTKELLQSPATKVNLYAIASVDENNGRYLAIRRSDAVLRFFAEEGIALERIQSFYYGNKKTRNGCVSENCPESLQRENRTVSIELVK